MKLTTSLFLTVLVVAFGTLARADSVVTRVTNNGYNDSFPHMKGDYLVWQAQIGSDQEILLYNTATGITTQITDNEYDDISPQTDGSYIVWQGFENGEWDVFVWNGGVPQAISDVGAQDYSPRIADGLVVWTSEPMYVNSSIGPGEIVLYDTGTQTLTVLSVDVDPGNAFDDTSPRINDEVVIWLQTDDKSDVRIYMYDLSNGTITENLDYEFRDSTRTDGNLSVLSRKAGQDREIFLYNSESTMYHQISDNTFHDRYPCINGNHIAWMADGEIFLAEFKHLGLISPRDNAAIPKSETASFTWEGIGYNAFKVEFSPDEDFQEEHTLALPQGEALFTESSFTPMMSEWWLIRMMARISGRVYWRVEAETTKGSAAMSETRMFSIADTGAGNMDQGDLSIAGNGDSGGGSSVCFIDTAGR